MSTNARNRTTELRQMIEGYQLTQAIAVAATLGIADLLAAGPKSSDELAQATGAHPESLRRLLCALSAREIFTEEAGSLFGLNPLAEGLRSDVPGSLKASAVQSGQPYMWAAWGAFPHSVMTGEAAFRKAHGMSAWDYRERHPAAGEMFDSAMQESAWNVAESIVNAYTFESALTVVDVGGGTGTLLLAILRTNSETHGILYDQQPVVSRAKTLLKDTGLAERCSMIPGDFFDSVPKSGDLYLLKGIIHDWNDAHALRILENCRHSMDSESRLLLIEQIIPAEGRTDPFAHFMDLHMLAIHGAKERTEEDFIDLLASAGFQLSRILPTATGLFLIEATPGSRVADSRSQR